ncbi:MAG: hypothetical protein BJBARM5_0312 [Candidatus Parvarchaeum acidophilus ARMAN-5]|jgi:hypothetical protein|uniref:Uncharacterized protein n=1 Tax=Candidatus Parvarchaeum acidophilus ARMAN-5 TaxID=662762 RepID=D6GV12_PARA5|nr:MAG: hypothetical protein BJBARM5_0312 [Candidatus Parvarchaeum acidophilus ARMAN-5]
MDVEQFLFFEILIGIVISLTMFFLFYGNYSSIFPIGCDSSTNILQNQFTSAEYGYTNRMEGTPLFRCYLTNACFDAATAHQTCITHWCYYYNFVNGKGNQAAVQNCIGNPNSTIVSACSVVSPTNTADLESCADSTIVANNATDIQNCDISNPSCISGDGPYCPACAQQ